MAWQLLRFPFRQEVKMVGLSTGSRGRQGEDEGRALARRRLDRDSAAVPFDDLPDHGQADPGPGVLVAGMEALEDHEDPVEVLGLDPDPVVLHGKPPEASLAPGRDPDPGRDVGTAVLEGV